MRVLVTGFEPFDGATVNTSWQAVEELTRRGVPGLELVALRLPVEFGRAADLLCAELETYREPDAVVCLGEAAGRRAVTPERVAINLADAVRPDNAGHAPRDTPVTADGPLAYPTLLPARAMVEAARAARAPAELSYSAGTYVCNDVFYRLMRHEAGRDEARPAGFVHVPRATEYTRRPDEPSVPLELVVTALAAGLGVLAAAGPTPARRCGEAAWSVAWQE